MKTRLTLDDHREIGKELYEIRNALQRLSCRIANGTAKTGRAAKKSKRAKGSVDSLRYELDSMSSSLTGWHPKIYYPGIVEAKEDEA